MMMPENTQIQKSKQRLTSDIIMEAGRRLLTEMEKSSVADSNKHISMMLARSRSLDVLSSPSLLKSEKHYDSNDDASSASISISDESPNENKSSLLLKDEEASAGVLNSSPSQNKKSDSNSTLLKEKSELNYNNNHDSYRNSSSRSSSISTSSSGSSNYSSNHSKLARRSSSSTTDGAAGFQEVALNEPIRITGYLEKRSKVLGWKKFWFVLDGRLLTYYKSKTDYESLSACCGCVNLGIATTVRPIQLRGCKGYPLQIVTRSQVYYLRSPEKPILEQWLLAIQEAASSAPTSSALPSWHSNNNYLGSQYFRQFASQSQWSLNNSSEDITDISGRLGNLPDTFYQKRDKGSLIYPSPPKLPQPYPIIHKCHSFASLQTSVVSAFGGREGLYGRRVLLSSTENLRDLQEVRRSNSIKSATMQHSTSLLVLDSSPQAAELRKELTRKLSVGSNSSNQDSNDNEQNNGGSNVPTPKFLLLSAKKKLQMGQGVGGAEEESHHYDEIGDFILGKPHYENYDAEKSKGGSQPNSKRSSLRGESAEKESNIYEHVETGAPLSMTLDTEVPAPVIWEPINDSGCTNIKRFPPHRLSSGSNRNSLVSITEVPEDSNSPSPAKTPVLSSIPESSWRAGVEPFKSYSKPYSEDEVSSRSESFRSLPANADKITKKRKGKAAIGGFFAKVFGKGKGKGSKSDSQESLHKQMIITGPVDLRKQKQMQELPAKRPPSYPYKRSISTSSTNSGNNVATAQDQRPVEASKTSPTIPGSRMTINSTNVMDELKQKVGHITLKRTSSRSSSGSDTELSPPKETTSLPPTVEARVPYVPRLGVNSLGSTKPAPVLIFQMHGKGESNTDDDIIPTPVLTEKEKEVQTASICMSPENETSCSEAGTLPRIEPKPETAAKAIPIPPPPPPMPQKIINEDVMDGKVMKADIVKVQGTPPVVKRNAPRADQGTDFQSKLAKFNRLSQTLSANFIASLHPTNANPTFSTMTRSNSYKANRSKSNTKVVEALPPLPPKKKNADGTISASMGMISVYDVPSNNKPIKFPQLPKEDQNQRKESVTISEYIRDLTKKNSTPDIVLSGNNLKSLCLRDAMNDAKELRRTLDGNVSSDENLSVHKSDPAIMSIPPGRPPKPKPPAKPKSLEGLNRVKRTSESSVSSEGSSSDQSQLTPTQTISSQIQVKIRGMTNSPTTSNKSFNIDLIDGLSDVGLSDTKASDSSPEPESLNSKVCPLHLPVNFSFSTDVQTPESMVSYSDKIVPDSLAPTPDTQITLASRCDHRLEFEVDSDLEPLSINKLEIVIRDNDGSPGPAIYSPDNESRLDSLERRPGKVDSVTPTNSDILPPTIYQNLKFATVNTLIQEFETVEENEEEMSELYDDFPSEFYTPTPSSFSGYSPSDISTASSDSSSSPISVASSTVKKHARIDAIRHSGMEQLEAFLNFGGTSSSDECSFESCLDSFSEDGSKSSGTPTTPIPMNHNNNVSKSNGSSYLAGPQQIHTGGVQAPTSGSGVNRTGAISRLGHSSAVGHLQKILTSDAK